MWPEIYFRVMGLPKGCSAPAQHNTRTGHNSGVVKPIWSSRPQHWNFAFSAFPFREVVPSFQGDEFP